MNKRIEILRENMQKKGIDQLLISDYYNLLYYGDVRIHSGERLLVLLINQTGENYLFVNELFTAKDSSDYQIIYYNDTQDSIGVLAPYLTQKNIAIDEQWTAGFLLRLMAMKTANYHSAKPLLIHQRAIKSVQEQQWMIQASLDNDSVMNQIIPYIRLGISERQLHDQLLELFQKQTGETVSFDPIVAFGKNCSDPHHESDDTVLEKGDTILIDMGSHYHDYCSDMTRTFLQKDSKAFAIYDIVKQANCLAEQAIKPGRRFQEIDAIARNYISEKGYGPYFTHRLGHGIGLEVHEGYDVSANNETIIEEGMCFSIEPGIYLPNETGVRIEDLVICQKDGAIVLNHFTKEPIILDLS